MEVMKFDKYYDKIKGKTFTTIRDHYKPIKIGSLVECHIKVGKYEEDIIIIHARLEKIEIQTLILVDEELLAEDLDIRYNGEDSYFGDVMNELRKFYPDLNYDDNVVIYYFKRQ